MDMDKTILKTFCKYQQTVLFEERQFEKFCEEVLIDPAEKLVTYYIFEQHMEGSHPSQTDILYALRMSHSTLRKKLKKLIKIGYIEPCKKNDARLTHYKPTEMVIEGFKIHTARHCKTLLSIAAALGDRIDIVNILNTELDTLLGSYSSHKAYGDMDLDYIKDVLNTMERHRK
jgi:DNA-binding MarR family transcriptional regulator